MATKTPIVLGTNQHVPLASGDTFSANSIPISTAADNNLEIKDDGLYAGTTTPPATKVTLSGDVTGTATANSAGLVSITTAIAGFDASLEQNGYQKFSSGLIMQWGYIADTTTSDYNFPISFPTAALVIMASNADAQGDRVDNAYAYIVSKKAFFVNTRASDKDHTDSNYPVYWLAIGY